MTRLLTLLIASVAACLWSFGAAAQAYPNHAIKLIVPYPAGGNTDIVARIYSQKLAERLGQPVVIDNRGGAAGTLGVSAGTKAPNDGYNFVVGDLGSLVIAPLTNKNVDYKPEKDLTSVGLIASVSIVVTVHPNSVDKTFAEFLARAKANPGKLTYGSAGVGAAPHLAFELLQSMAGIQLLHVPFKGGAQAVTGLLGEQVDIVVDGTAFAHAKGGRLRALAVTGPRLPALPDVPGIGEFVPGYNFTNWWGILAPAGVPAEAVKRINEELVAIAAMPEVRDKLRDLGLAAQSSTAQQFADQIRSETEKMQRILATPGLKLN